MIEQVVNDRYEDVLGLSLLAEDQRRREIAWIEMEPLTQEEEDRLFAQMIRAYRDPVNQWRATIAKQARARVVEAYQPIVFHVAQKAVRRVSDIELLDAVSEGNIGLLTAIDSYVSRYSCVGSFKALAITCVGHAIWHARYERGGLFSVPHYQAVSLSRLHRTSVKFLHDYGYEPSVADLADLMEISEEEVSRLQSLAYARRSESLQSLISEEVDASDRLDFTPVFCGAGPGEQKVSSLKRALRVAIMKELAPRQREAIIRFYGFSDDDMCMSSQAEGEQKIPSRRLLEYVKNATSRLSCVLRPLLDENDTCVGSCEEYYSTKEVASLLGISLTTVKDRARNGLLPAKRLGMPRSTQIVKLQFPKRAIDALVAHRQEVSA